jgi:hypothetical protein
MRAATGEGGISFPARRMSGGSRASATMMAAALPQPHRYHLAAWTALRIGSHRTGGDAGFKYDLTADCHSQPTPYRPFSSTLSNPYSVMTAMETQRVDGVRKGERLQELSSVKTTSLEIVVYKRSRDSLQWEMSSDQQ